MGLDFVVVLYDDEHWIGLVEFVNKENEDVKVKFMHPHYPSRCYCWPAREDTCLVPPVNFLCRINAPMTITGRQYHLCDNDITLIQVELNKLK